jgi:hypothetical protein
MTLVAQPRVEVDSVYRFTVVAARLRAAIDQFSNSKRIGQPTPENPLAAFAAQCGDGCFGRTAIEF